MSSEIKKCLEKRAGSLKEEDDLLIGYWMIEFLGVSRETSKDKLDSIIDPKIKLNKTYIEQRIKELN